MDSNSKSIKSTYNGIKTFYAKDRKSWRTWLQKNGIKQESVWLIIYKKGATTRSITYVEAVEEALCFGWIDSKPNKRDHESFYQFFSQRNPKSNWSKINKDRVVKLTQEGLMTPLGLDIIEQAKQNGAWTSLDRIESLEIPADLNQQLSRNKEASRHFEAFPKSVKKGILEWIHNAKTDMTRAKRIAETVRLAADNIRANQYRQKP